ncbi:MAG: sigma-70 family RNA polymerase sigma factor [Kofleriaceae bacterium]|nr:sigma-70 family RNA polymerase sigma factor [Kofleriaceae bacterium]
MHRLAVALVKDEAAADDLVQDTYSIAATQAPTDGRPLRPWLARVLWNRVRMASRTARRRRAREQAFGELAAPPARPDEIVDRIELQRTLAGLVLELAAPQRDVLLLHYFEGLTSSQIGQRLAISPGTVRWRLKQAIDELRDRLDQRSPNRAWVASLATFARTAPSAKLALLPKLLFAAFVLLAIGALALRAQLSEAQRAAPGRAATHAPARPAALPMLADTSSPGHASAALGSGPVFSAEQRSLGGLVIDGSGQGVADADVELDCGYAGGAKLKQRTGVGGAFAFEIDPHCHYVVTATKGDARGEQRWSGPTGLLFGPSTKAEVDALGGPLAIERYRTTVQLRRLSLAVIRVVDADTGGPIANAKISSRWYFDDGVSAVTGPDGIARVNVQVPSRILVDADHYAYAEEVLDNPNLRGGLRDRTAILLRPGPFETPAQLSLDIRLSRSIAVSGIVLGPDGKAIADASVSISGPLGVGRIVEWPAKTDASGNFETKVPTAGRYALSADRRDLTTNGAVVVDIPAEGRANLIAHVVPRGEIHGTVVDLSARPVAGARVSLADGTIPPVVADAQGRFVIAHVDGAIDLIANRGADASAFHHVQLKPGDRAEVVLQVGATGISGVAVEHDGSPVEGAEVWLNFCCESNPNLVEGKRITTDATGRFSFDTPRGDFVLSVKRDEDDDYEGEDDLKVAGGTHDVRLLVP